MLILAPLLAGMASAMAPFRVASWNVYYKALDDPFGQKAITEALDNAHALSPFDFVGVVEAQGDTALGNFSTWPETSTALKSDGSMSFLTGYEVMGLFYSTAKWEPVYHLTGEFEKGRPFLLAQFAPKEQHQSNSTADETVWIMLVHLNHYFIVYPGQLDHVIPGRVMAAAFNAAEAATGTKISQGNVVIMGDFNEYEWADMDQPYQADCVKKMAPLWDGYFNGRMRDVVPPKTVSCCSKWAAADRATRTEWDFEYDHIFISDSLSETSASGEASFIPYVYPGTQGTCSDAYCTGQNPPGNITATHQGSWHRGFQAGFKSAADHS
jgi:endonuclease/exonuclease/phosphatase family metal-dependent hydrolase